MCLGELPRNKNPGPLFAGMATEAVLMPDGFFVAQIPDA